MSIIPRHHRKFLRSVGFRYWVWKRAWDWAFGKRYQFRDGSLAYVKNGEIITIRRGDKIIWKKETV